MGKEAVGLPAFKWQSWSSDIASSTFCASGPSHITAGSVLSLVSPEAADTQLWRGKVDRTRLRHATSLSLLFSSFQDGRGTENHVPEGGGAEQAVRTLGHAEERDCVSPRERKYPLSPLTFLLSAPGAEKA